jgi:hypothetical protein
MAKNNTEGFSKELLDQLLAGRDPKTALDSSGLIGDLKKALAGRMRHAGLMCERSPPHGPLLELPIYVGDTQETRKLKGPRGCPRDSEQRSFWTEQFKLGKRVEPALPADIRDSAPVASDLAVIIDDWTFQGDDAQKTIETACAGFSGLQGLPGFEGLPVGNVMCEKTVLKLKRKR